MVLLSVGVGITPMIAIANFIVEEGLRTRANTFRSIFEVLFCCSTPRSPSGSETCGDDVGVVLDL